MSHTCLFSHSELSHRVNMTRSHHHTCEHEAWHLCFPLKHTNHTCCVSRVARIEKERWSRLHLKRNERVHIEIFYKMDFSCGRGKSELSLRHLGFSFSGEISAPFALHWMSWDNKDVLQGWWSHPCLLRPQERCSRSSWRCFDSVWMKPREDSGIPASVEFQAYAVENPSQSGWWGAARPKVSLWAGCYATFLGLFKVETEWMLESNHPLLWSSLTFRVRSQLITLAGESAQ